MDIKLTWKTAGLGPNYRVRIYRSLTNLREQEKGTLLAEPVASTGTYTDVDIPVNAVTFYRIAFVDPNDVEVLGPVQAIGNFPNGTGPGPAAPIRGDWVTGYFGKVPVDLMITGTALKAALGLTTGYTAGLTDAQLPYYHKWVIEGEIIFVPPGWLIKNIAWVDLYNKGLMFGVDNVGPVADLKITGYVAKNQLTRIVAGGFNFRVRTPKCFFAPLNAFLPLAAADVLGVYNKTEWEKISLTLYATPRTKPGEDLPKFYHYTSGNTEFSMMGTIGQHIATAAGAFIYRGRPGTNLDSNNNSSGKSTTVGWVPILVLEL